MDNGQPFAPSSRRRHRELTPAKKRPKMGNWTFSLRQDQVVAGINADRAVGVILCCKFPGSDRDRDRGSYIPHEELCFAVACTRCMKV
ncbi:hypothetical protein DPEC_G00195610 [Dallia pectoralis]|uniref:Uncharacterized protein n=1 Tax=Dallia pectoralis TaxID=75939 RepID=A0ACC2G7C9_DALPE|nr:hypothetical protein DPEC_G00195610 [Dallia pectoralis]